MMRIIYRKIYIRSRPKIRRISEALYFRLNFGIRLLEAGIAFMLILTTASSSARAAEPASVCFAHWPPYHVIREDGEAAGISVEITDRVLADLGRRAVYGVLPYRRCVRDVREGRIDLMLSSGGEEGLALVEPHKTVWLIGFAVPVESPRRRIEALKDAVGLRIGVESAYEPPPAFMNFADWTIEYVPSHESNVAMLRGGRVDLILTDMVYVAHQPSSANASIRLLQPPVVVAPQPDAFRPDLGALRDRYAEALRARMAAGELDALYERELGVSLSALSARALLD